MADLVGGAPELVPAVAEGRGAAQGRGPVSADHDHQWAGGAWGEQGVVELDVRAVKRRVVVFEQGAERADVFVLELSAVVEVGAQERVLAFDPSGGDAECEPAAGEVVQCRGLFGDEQRVALGQGENAGREADGAGVGGDPGERGEAFEQVPNGSGSLVGGSRTWSLVHSEV